MDWNAFAKSAWENSEKILQVISFAAIAGAWVAGRKTGYAKAKKELTLKREWDRLRKVYSPLNSLFMTHHLTLSGAEGAPRFSQRAQNAWDQLSEGKLRRAVKALFDRQRFPEAGEFEYGRSMPMQQIERI